MRPTLIAFLAIFQLSYNEGRALSPAVGGLKDSAVMARDRGVILCAGYSKACAVMGEESDKGMMGPTET